MKNSWPALRRRAVLRMAVSGLVPELTAEAARSAALGAGSKFVKSFIPRTLNSDLAEILTIDPEIFLLTEARMAAIGK